MVVAIAGTKQGVTPTNGTSFNVDITDVAVGTAMVLATQTSQEGVTLTFPAGWTPILSYVRMGTRRVHLLAKIKVSGDGNTIPVTLTTNTAQTSWHLVTATGTGPVSEWKIGLAGVRAAVDVVSGQSVQAGSSTTSVAPSITTILADTLALAMFFEVTSATETGPPYYQTAPSGWTEAYYGQIHGEWIMSGTKAMPATGTTGDATMTYKNPQANNGMGIQIGITPAGVAAPKTGTFGTGIEVGGTFSGQAPVVIPEEISLVGVPTTVGINAPYSAGTWVLAKPGVTLVAGDMLVAALRSQNSVGPLPTMPDSTWTLATDPPGGYTGPRTHALAYHRVTDPDSEPASYTFTQSQALRRGGAMFVLRPSAGKVIVEDSHSPLYAPVNVGALYRAAGWDVNQVPGLVIAAFSAEFASPESHLHDAEPAGFTTIVDVATGTDISTTSRTDLWVGMRKLTAEPMPAMDMDWVGAPTGPGFDAVMFREIAPGNGEGTFGTPISVGVQGYFGGTRPPKAGSRFNNVAHFLATPGATSAHRGDSQNNPEMSWRGYDRALAQGFNLLEFSAQRSLDGVWLGSHDPDPNRTSMTTGLPNFSTMLWADIQKLENKLNANGFPVQYIRMDEFLAKYTPQALVMLDPKNALAYVDEFNAIAENYGGPNRIIMKYFGPGAAIGAVARNWRSLGYETWGYFYQAQVDNGELATYQDNWTILGMEYGASTAAWTQVTGYDVTPGFGRTGKKPVMGHIAYAQANYDMAMAKGAKYVQVGNATLVAGVGAESTPTPPPGKGTFGGTIQIGPAFFGGTRPVEGTTMIGYGRVKGRFLAGVEDSADAGLEPDIAPLVGYVVFTAGINDFRMVNAVPDPVTVYVAPIQVNLDESGYITSVNDKLVSLFATNDPDGSPVGWRWKVSFYLKYNGREVPIPSFWFELPEGRVVDLTTVTRHAGPTGA